MCVVCTVWIMKPRHTSSNKMGKPAGGRSAKNPFKSQNQQGPPSKKKRADEQDKKQRENASSKKVKLSSAAIGSWQPLSESSKLFLENIVDSVVLSVLSQQRERKDDVQKHLNVLKERVLRSFKTLKVPPGKLGNLKNILSLQMAEKQMLETNEESLLQLQEEITEAKRSAERIEENIQQLQYKIQVLKNQLEEDEKRARKVFQENGNGVLHLPELPKRSLQAPTLQEEILKVKNQKDLLKDLNAIHRSADLKNLLTLVEKTYEKQTEGAPGKPKRNKKWEQGWVPNTYSQELESKDRDNSSNDPNEHGRKRVDCQQMPQTVSEQIRCSQQYTALTRDPWHSLDGGCSSQVPSDVQFLSLILLTMLVNTLLCRCSGNPDNMYHEQSSGLDEALYILDTLPGVLEKESSNFQGLAENNLKHKSNHEWEVVVELAGILHWRTPILVN
ncbi:hypothetical protein IHE44_0009790 [Lamprotornis superbus]|uniref:Centromere protein Q n=1 Tax=Lamprotornis superbus TaxID=245042 RepID=A0A835TRS7_9PASS|nr:hypothetical protein IHE44_0009790 [Lamprotornis superbus]